MATRDPFQKRVHRILMALLLSLSMVAGLTMTTGCDFWDALCVESGDDNSDFDFDEIGDEIEDEFDDEF